MKTIDFFPNLNPLNKAGESAEKYHQIDDIAFPVLALILSGIFAGLAFTPIAKSSSFNEGSIPEVFDKNPTPIPDDSFDGKKFALLPSSIKKEDPSPEKSDLDFASYRYHSWDIPDEITVGNDFWIEIDLTNQILYAI